MTGRIQFPSVNAVPWHDDILKHRLRNGKGELALLSRFHPLYHSYTYLAGSRVDIERVLEDTIDYMDPEELVDDFSEPPHFYERLSPVSTIIGDAPVKGRNWTDMMIKCYRMFGKIFTRSAIVLEQALEANESEQPMVPFMSITVDPDTLVRLIERDYEAGETSYTKLIELFESGIIAPTLTVPFHPILPLLRSDFDRRLCLQLGLLFFEPILRTYEKHLKEIGQNQMVLGFWAPNSVVNADLMEMVEEEFQNFCSKNKFAKPHLVFLLDADLCPDVPLDKVMKHWCVTPIGSDKNKTTSVVFRDPVFSDWMMTSHPSIKKILDRTIAKVDANLSEREVDYSWAHFESLEVLTYSPRDAVHLEQRILKLCELGYQALSPDAFIRQKLNGTFGVEESEPMQVELVDHKPETDPLGDESYYGKWRGWAYDENKKVQVMPNMPYVRKANRGTQKSPGYQCWKIAWNLTQEKCFEVLGGNPEKMTGGMLALLGKISGKKQKKALADAVESFLVEYGFIYWREHFIQHDMSEGDIRLDEILDRTLRKGQRKAATPKEMVAAACAAQAYYFLLDSCNSYALQAENMDQRALFQNVVMLTLAFCHGVAAYHYMGMKAKANELVDILETELIDFESAFERYELEKYGVSEKEWKQVLKPEITDSKLNVVSRAVRRTASRHLAEFGYDDRFPEEDEEITTNCGHNWTAEVNIPNYKWANPQFCGVREA